MEVNPFPGGGGGGNGVKDLVAKEEGGEALGHTYYSFKLVGGASCLSKVKGLKESLLQWLVHY